MAAGSLLVVATVPPAVPAGAATFAGGNGLIAFSEFAESTPGSQIMAVDPTTLGETDLSQDVYGDDEPAWSPNGTMLAFRHGGSIWTMTSTGGSRRDLTPKHQGSFGEPAWSPDGKKIVFDDNGNIATMTAKGKDIEVLTTSGNNFTPDWSPDGKQLAYVSQDDPGGIDHVFVMRPDGTHRVDISGVTDKADVDYDDAPSWSPDSRHLVVQSGRSSSGIQVYELSSNGKSAEQITNVFDNAYGPVLSPDSSLVAYVANDNGSSQIFVQTPGVDATPTVLTDGPDTAIGDDPSWQATPSP